MLSLGNQFSNFEKSGKEAPTRICKANVHTTMEMDSLSKLERDGYVTISGIGTALELLAIAKSIGRPVPSPTGELVKEIMPKSKGEARLGTASAKHGTGSFPL